jgi:hypothetical protein
MGSAGRRPALSEAEGDLLFADADAQKGNVLYVRFGTTLTAFEQRQPDHGPFQFLSRSPKPRFANPARRLRCLKIRFASPPDPHKRSARHMLS